MASDFNLFVDFDGTISRGDTTDLILAEFADPRWAKRSKTRGSPVGLVHASAFTKRLT